MLPKLNGPADRLDQIYLTLRPEPLIEPDEFKAFYRQQVNAVRGEDTVGRLSAKLHQAYGAIPFKAFVMGHPGVGKSTEISRLLSRVNSLFTGVRLSIANATQSSQF
jgi:hypothetical protein